MPSAGPTWISLLNHSAIRLLNEALGRLIRPHPIPTGPDQFPPAPTSPLIPSDSRTPPDLIKQS